jgi:hypothetical protein
MTSRIESMRGSVARGALGSAMIAIVLCGCARRVTEVATDSPPAGDARKRAILVSFDSFSERRMLESLPAEAVPSIRRLFVRSACAAYARPAFPSLTAPGHASLWTGAYGNVSGIAANDQQLLPLDEHTILDRISGFSFAALRAEPLWLTAARAGVSVVGHHVTQAPGPPGFPAVQSPPDDSLLVRRAAASRDLLRPGVEVLNGYNRDLARDTILTERHAPPRPAAGWRNAEVLGSGVPPLEIAWTTGADSIFALLHGASAYDRVLVALARDASRGVTAPAAPPDTAPLPGRTLARFYSDPLPLRVAGGVAHLVVRLFALSPDGSRFELFMPEVNVVEANRSEVAAAYGAAVGGWAGNAAGSLLRRGRFGRTLAQGGDGSAESRWLDAAEYQTRQSIRGSEWAWRIRDATLLLDYFPLGDETDHMFYGIVSFDGPPRDPALVSAIRRVRARAWQLVDRRLGDLQELVAGDANAMLLVSGDHGMRTTWRTFRPNVALADARLLARDDNGRPVLGGTRALSANGYYIKINTTAHREGIVPPDSADEVARAVIAALRSVRDSAGTAVVTGAWIAAELDSLGVGGAAGGDVYFELAPGYRSSWDTRGPVTTSSPIEGGHGFRSTAPDMQTVLCAYGEGIAPRRTGPVRTIDAAPTVAEWLGMPAPRDARGRSVLSELLGR